MGREFELKYKAEPDVLAAIAEKYGGFSEITMETAYFDTPDWALARRKWMLRRRLENGVSVCTLKTPLPDGSRGEWNVECPDIQAGVAELCKLGISDDLAALTKDGLRETCAARFTRLASTIQLEDCTVEIALDRGCFLGGGREVPFAEVEVELKGGSEYAAVAFAEELAKEFRLSPERKSKAQRARALVNPVEN